MDNIRELNSQLHSLHIIMLVLNSVVSLNLDYVILFFLRTYTVLQGR
jgi:hypothetical protein